MIAVKIIKTFSALFCAVLITVCTFSSVQAQTRDSTAAVTDPTQWTAVDGLGRTLPKYTDVGGKNSEKQVGVFYWTWHYNWATTHEPKNVREILDLHPDAVNDFSHPAWNNTYSQYPHYWDTPLYGYYTEFDSYVLRQHAEMLGDAGVDVIIFDCTNATETWMPGTLNLFRVFEQAKADGINVPQIAFMLSFGDRELNTIKLKQLYKDIYSVGLYKDLWYYRDGKPLIMSNEGNITAECEDSEILDFFTFRYNEPAYFAKDTKPNEKTWGWCSVYPQTKFGKKLFPYSVEQMCVSVAQNANYDTLCAMNDPDGGVRGRSYTLGDYSYSYTYAGKTVTATSDTENSLLYGLNFQQQWDYALEIDPDFIFVTGWNEWIAGRHEEWMETENAFPDQFSPEYSRDIEPSAGVLKDYYYYQLVANIRAYKGVSPPAAANTKKTIDITAGLSQWDNVKPEYIHYTDSNSVRDCDGWLGTHYANDTLINDIVGAKAAYDDSNVYFLVNTADDLVAPDASNRMALFIDTDESGVSPNWEGFEFAALYNPDTDSYDIVKSTGGWQSVTVGIADYCISGNSLMLAVSRDNLGLDGENVKFNFKWLDNVPLDGDILAVYQNGDAAPGGRFAFAFDSATAEGTDNVKSEKSFLENAIESIRKIVKFEICEIFKETWFDLQFSR